MSDIEKRARDLLAELARNFGQPEYAYHIGCGGFLDAADRKVIAPIIAALTPPEGYMLIQNIDAKRLSDGDTNSPGWELSACRVRAAMLAARPEVQP